MSWTIAVFVLLLLLPPTSAAELPPGSGADSTQSEPESASGISQTPTLQPKDICLDAALPAPAGDPIPVRGEAHPSGALSPVDLTQLTEVPLHGYYVDMDGKVFRYKDIRRMVYDTVLDSAPTEHTAEEFYTGEWKTVGGEMIMVNGVPMSTLRFTVPEDRVAFREAKDKARKMNSAQRGSRALFGRQERFATALCAYNTHAQYMIRRATAREQTEAEPEGLIAVAGDRAPDPPEMAWTLTARAYEALELEKPADAAQQQADAAAIWAAVQAMGDFDLVLADAKRRKALSTEPVTLSALLATTLP